ncbi:hypothetical protein DE146DRAFT_586963, partial [Phaeosphaeria sp. MPI-PUGE-AT-0046c]
MPTDQHGVTHSGTIGLFDDDDELQTAMTRAERHERERLEAQIRRHEQHGQRKERKEARAAIKQGREISKLVSLFLWPGRLFGRGKKSKLDATSSKGEADKPASGGHETTEYVVVRRTLTLEMVYTAQDVDPIDSSWLQECGMERVKSDGAGGCHIVPKSSVQNSD